MAEDTDPDLELRLRQSFGRLRERGASSLPGPLADGEADPEEPVREPSVPAKSFIGPNATFYDDRWRWMDWRGQQRSWNWAAATTLGAWFAYRRLYGCLSAFGVLMLLVLTLLMTGVASAIPLGLLLAGMIGAGLYGNFLYLRRYRQVAREIVERYDEHEDQVREIERAGGVDPRAAYAWPAVLTLAALLIAAGLHVAGAGPTFNL
ncbi:MAG TPA: DUF2628 domain-containing protein [Geminicoccaceae bacterium]